MLLEAKPSMTLSERRLAGTNQQGNNRTTQDLIHHGPPFVLVGNPDMQRTCQIVASYPLFSRQPLVPADEPSPYFSRQMFGDSWLSGRLQS